MSNLQYYAYPTAGEEKLKQHGYSQAVRVGDRIECAGQGGWDPHSNLYPTSLTQQIDQAFANVALNLQHAGGQGWSQVFRVNSYHVGMSDDALAAMTRNFKKWMPHHAPIWTCVGVERLGDEEMKVEIEVVALDEKGAEKAREAGRR
ncbi:hypothetical protein BGAL_0597g00090 [Botrytis galanthina]|uniref:Uncharacterized protein n=1 Tax=Botrytis galanthina TaxID=278940 RepID=A0A4S8QVA9_9HELO|nr:hypothetical protein BGAL_0597g00090 [Botrytis galanthina]